MEWNRVFTYSSYFWETQKTHSCWDLYCNEGSTPRSPPSTHRKHSHWTLSDDKKLRKKAQKYNYDWDRLVAFFPGKSPYELQTRWKNKVDPSINHSEWSPYEDEQLKILVLRYGEDWNAITLHIEGRPPRALRTRYFHLSEQIEREESSSMELDLENSSVEVSTEGNKEEKIESLNQRIELATTLIQMNEFRISQLQMEMYQDDKL